MYSNRILQHAATPRRAGRLGCAGAKRHRERHL